MICRWVLKMMNRKKSDLEEIVKLDSDYIRFL